MTNLDLSFLREAVPQMMSTLPVVAAIILGAAAVNLVLSRMIHWASSSAHLSHNTLAPVRRILTWTIWLIALILVLSVIGIEITGLWTVVSTVLAMIAIGFVAVWSVLSNVSCTVIMLIARPFNIGDEIEFAGEPIKGRVVDLNFVYTTLQDEEGRLQQIPNNLFFQKMIKRRLNPLPVTLAAQLSSKQRAQI
jgi:Small-conductance mechanosensitive channel